MEKYVIQIEQFLRGQMSQEEEGAFKTSLMSNETQHSLAYIVTFILKKSR